MNDSIVKCSRLFNYFCNVECKGQFPPQLIELLKRKPKRVREFDKGEHIAFQGDVVDSLMLLIKGAVRMEIISDVGSALYMSQHTATFPIGASFLFSTDNKFNYDVIATEPSIVEYYDIAGVEQAMESCPYFRRGFLRYSSDQLQELSKRLQIFSIKKIRSKLAYYILDKADSDGRFELEMSVTALAEYFGVTRSALSRVISELCCFEMIEYGQGVGQIIDRQKLEAEIE